MMLQSHRSLAARAAHRPAVVPRPLPAGAKTPRECHCRVATGSAAATQLALHISETTIQLPFGADQAKTLDTALAKLLQTFADKQEAKRPRRWDMMEVRFAGAQAGEGVEVVEVFCNPNAHATAFDAKLLITILAQGGLKVVCEGRLSSIKADLDAYMQNVQ